MALLPNHYLHHDSYESPPYPQSRNEVNPTILVSWWCTLFSVVIILIRLGGRWVRTERLFVEDRIMALAIIPAFLRMGCVHFVLKWGTNNVVLTTLTSEDIAHREIGSKLVLAARIFYAMFIWIAKLSICDFLYRIYSQMWTRKLDFGLKCIKWFLVATFIAVFISTLAECRPFSHYWQVVPDPGASCRESYSQLLTMGICDSITDLILVAFPLPIIFTSTMRLERKISLSCLFSMSLILVAITIYRVDATVSHHYDQRFRSLLASFEILAATGVANAIVLGSFLRDRGIKKNKYKGNESTGCDSVLDRPVLAPRTRSNNKLNNIQNGGGNGSGSGSSSIGVATNASSSQAARHVRGMHSWGSDIDLVGDLGMRLGPEFHSEKPTVARPAPAVLPLLPLSRDGRTVVQQRDWAFDEVGRERRDSEVDPGDHRPPRLDVARNSGGGCRRGGSSWYDDGELSPTSPFTPARMNFFDVGGLLDGPPGSTTGPGVPGSPMRSRRRRRASSVSFAPLPSANSTAPLIPMELRGVSPSRSEASGESSVRTRMRFGGMGGTAVVEDEENDDDGKDNNDDGFNGRYLQVGGMPGHYSASAAANAGRKIAAALEAVKRGEGGSSGSSQTGSTSETNSLSESSSLKK